jgi:uncharacterized protein (DUF58 family)
MTFHDWLATCETALTLHTSTRLRQAQVGEHRSVYTGTGLRLHHHEEYRPGDERRRIDWKASRKDRTLLARRFETEKQLQVLAVCDVSTSMLFGQSVPKHRVALDCAGVLGLATLQQGDAFGLLAFANTPIAYFPPRQQRNAVLHALESLWSYDPAAAATTTTQALPVLQYLPTHRPLLVCVLSDFCAPDWQPALDILSATHDTLAVLIADDAECALPTVGGLVVYDLESGQMMELDTASTTYRQAFREQMLAAQEAREQLLRRTCGAQYVVATTTTDYRSDLLRLFLTRTARLWM